MKITFYGAAGDVTGSNSLVEIAGQKFLIDCGMFQGSDFLEAKNSDPLPYDPKDIKAVFITHAHLDHVGRLPVLIKNGFSGYIYTTQPTIELTELTLRDAAQIMHYDHEKFQRPILYTDEDVSKVMAQCKPVKYGEPFSIGQRDIKFVFHDAGHIFGSAFIEIQAPPESGQGKGKKVVFSGDVGNEQVPILRDTESLPTDLDALICESTYGDRLHESSAERQRIIETTIADAIGRGGVLMIPSFSIERTQELIYELNDLIDHKQRLRRIPIFLDSPMAIDAVKVFKKYPEYYDAEAHNLIKDGDDMFDFPGMMATYTRDESMKINHTPGSKIIIAGAGMMNGGRILHHALRYLSDEKSTLLIIGYQSKGTLGRQIQEGISPVRVLGEEVAVRCQVRTIGALSAHGDQKKLVNWIGAAKPKQVFLNHGEEASSGALANVLARNGIPATPVKENMVIEV